MYKRQFDYQVTISGRPQAGDNFSVSFNTNGVSDNRNALNLVNLQNKSVIGVNPGAPTTTGSSFSDAYGDLVERVGTLTSQARVDSQATAAIDVYKRQAFVYRMGAEGTSFGKRYGWRGGTSVFR